MNRQMLRDIIVQCIREAADRAYEAGVAGEVRFTFMDVIARAEAALRSAEAEPAQ